MTATNVKSEWVGGDLYFYDKSGNQIMNLDGTNRALEFPSGSTLAMSGTMTAAALTATAFNYTPVARTATADGLTTGTIADAGMLQFVTVTSANADHIIVLPTPTPGTIVILRNGATGYELRTSAPATIAINGGAGASAESAIAASSMVIAVCTTATTWQAITIAATTLAAVEAAA